MYAGIQDPYGRHMMLACTRKWDWDLLGRKSSPARSTHTLFTCRLSTYCKIMVTDTVSCTLVVLTMYLCTLHIYNFSSNGPINISTSNRSEAVDLVMNRMCSDESSRTCSTNIVCWPYWWSWNQASQSLLLVDLAQPPRCRGDYGVFLSSDLVATPYVSSASVACTAPIYEGPLLSEGDRRAFTLSCDWGI